MHSIPRRRLLALVAPLIVVAPLACRQARAGNGRPAWPPADPAEPAGAVDGAGADDPLLPQAADWVAAMRTQGQQILLYPISRLQRRFRIGYNRTCALVAALERRGDWAIALDTAGSRYARILPQGRV